MCRNEIETKFKALLANFFNCGEDKFNNDTNFIEDFGIDSLGILMLICLVEESFGIVNGDQSKYFELITYKKALEYLCEQCSTQKK